MNVGSTVEVRNAAEQIGNEKIMWQDNCFGFALGRIKNSRLVNPIHCTRHEL